MDTQLYLIHGDDYIAHIDGQLEMYALLLSALNKLRNMARRNKSAEFMQTLTKYENEANELFRKWGIPDSYLLGRKPWALKKIMDAELLPVDPVDDGNAPDMQAIDNLLDMSNTLADSIAKASSVLQKLMDETDEMLDELMEDRRGE